MKMNRRVQYLLECYSGERFLEPSEDTERSSESEEYAVWEVQSACVNILPMIEPQEVQVNARAVPNLAPRQLQDIRNLTSELKRVADSMKIIKPGSALLSVERGIVLNQGLSQEEMHVVNGIVSENTPTISKIADHLGQYLSSRTFQAALRYLSYSATSPIQELALSCELVKVIRPGIRRLSRADSVYDTINEFIDRKMEEVLH